MRSEGCILHELPVRSLTSFMFLTQTSACLPKFFCSNLSLAFVVLVSIVSRSSYFYFKRSSAAVWAGAQTAQGVTYVLRPGL